VFTDQARGALAAVYSWLDGGDAATARVITVWTEE